VKLKYLEFTKNWAKLVQVMWAIWLSCNKNCRKKQSSQFSTQFLSPCSPLWSWVLGVDQKNTIACASVRNEIFLKNWWSYVIRQTAQLRNSTISEHWAATSLNRKISA